MLLDEWKVPPAKVAMLNPGVDIDYFTPPEDVDAVRDRLGWTGRRVLLSVGRLQRRKGQDIAIAAVAELARSFPDLLYVIVGEGEDHERLRDIVREQAADKHVQFQGELDDTGLLDCYQGCDFFALPNRTIGGDVEGFGMVLIEAQACGKPVIAGRSGGTVDTLDDGVTGVLLDCTSPAELKATLGNWLANPDVPRAMAHGAREFVASRFSWNALAAKADALFLKEDSPS